MQQRLAPSTRLTSRRNFAVPGAPCHTPGGKGQRTDAFGLPPTQLPNCLPYSYPLQSGVLTGQMKCPWEPFLSTGPVGSCGSEIGHELWLQ